MSRKPERPPPDRRRKVRFREIARGIVAKDRYNRKYGLAVDTAGAIARHWSELEAMVLAVPAPIRSPDIRCRATGYRTHGMGADPAPPKNCFLEHLPVHAGAWRRAGIGRTPRFDHDQTGNGRWELVVPGRAIDKAISFVRPRNVPD
jgi:hypothetical protein